MFYTSAFLFLFVLHHTALLIRNTPLLPVSLGASTKLQSRSVKHEQVSPNFDVRVTAAQRDRPAQRPVVILSPADLAELVELAAAAKGDLRGVLSWCNQTATSSIMRGGITAAYNRR